MIEVKYKYAKQFKGQSIYRDIVYKYREVVDIIELEQLTVSEIILLYLHSFVIYSFTFFAFSFKHVNFSCVIFFSKTTGPIEGSCLSKVNVKCTNMFFPKNYEVE